MSRIEPLAGLSAATFVPHALHGEASVWPEKNCYIDLWLELLPALRLEPLAMLGFTLAVDFEGDQWTFFKPPHDELRALYGVDVQELTLWRPLLDHAVEHLQAGKFICCEVDAYWLPDTAGTDYRRQHSKTSILLGSLDPARKWLGYFHNAGYFELAGADFEALFALAPASVSAATGPSLPLPLPLPLPAHPLHNLSAEPLRNMPAHLPLYAELVRIDRLRRRPPAELAALARPLLALHLARRPLSNPFTRFAERLAHDLPGLQAGGLACYHAWAFASVRQAGAAFELASAHLRWLAAAPGPADAAWAGWGELDRLAGLEGLAGLDGLERLAEAAVCFDAISRACKSLILKGARAVHAGRPLAADALLDGMCRAWACGMGLLERAQVAADEPLSASAA